MLAEKTLAALNASGDKVVLLARAGQDLSNTACATRTWVWPTNGPTARAA